MGSESSLWNTISKNMKGKWEADRVENSVLLGMPDVYFTMIETGKMGWVELKYKSEWPKKLSTPLRVDHYTSQQKNWIKRHGELGANVFLLIQVGPLYFLYDWENALNVGNMTFSEMELTAECTWTNRIDYEQLAYFLK